MNDSLLTFWLQYLTGMANRTSGIFVGPWLEIIAQVLLHFLWQGFAIAILVHWLEGRSKSVQHRYRWGVLGLFLLVACPLLTGFWLSTNSSLENPIPDGRSSGFSNSTNSNLLVLEPEWETFASSHDSSQEHPNQAYIFGEEFERSAGSSREWTPQEPPVVGDSGQGLSLNMQTLEVKHKHRWSAWLVNVWLSGVIVLSLRLAAGWVVLTRLRRRCLPPDYQMQQLIQRLSQKMQLPSPRIGFSERAVGAMVLGLWRPMIIVPSAWVLEMSPATLEAILCHELAHLRRHDLWVLWLQRALETVWFFHPAVWWLSARVRYHRECCCDDLAVRATGQPVDYAKMLEQVAARSQRLRTPLLAAEISGKGKMMILRRVEQVLGLMPKGQEAESGAWLFLSLIVTSSLVIGLNWNSASVYGQDQQTVAETQIVKEDRTVEASEKNEGQAEQKAQSLSRQDNQTEQVHEELRREAREMKRRIQELKEIGKVEEAEQMELQLRKLREKLESKLHAQAIRERQKLEQRSDDSLRADQKIKSAHQAQQEAAKLLAKLEQNELAVQQYQQEVQMKYQSLSDLYLELRELQTMVDHLAILQTTLEPDHPAVARTMRKVERHNQALAARGIVPAEPTTTLSPRLAQLQVAMNQAIKQGQAEEVLELSRIIADHLRSQQRSDSPDHSQRSPRPAEDRPPVERPRDDRMDQQFAQMRAMFREMRAEMDQMRRQMEALRRDRQ